MSEAGKLFIFEGPDGTGKTTLSRAFTEALQKKGVACKWLAFPGSEGGSLGGLVYDLHHRPQQHGITKVHATSLQLLHVAAHIDAIERVILPTLRAGQTVILDRFWWSTWVYGVTSGADTRSLQQMIELEQSHWSEVRPAAIFLLKVPHPYDAPSVPHWNDLVAEYEKLADQEAVSNTVRRVSNDRSPQGTLDVLMREAGFSGKAKGDQRKVRRVVSPASRSVKAPTAWVKLAPLIPTAVYDTYWRFAAERQAIFFRRILGQEPPWTEDLVLREYKFTNAYRASDRVSQYLIRHVLYDEHPTPEDLCFRALLFKIFNRVETWELLRREIGTISFEEYSFGKYNAVLTRAIDSGERIYSAAYIMPTGGAGAVHKRKHRMHLRLLETMLREELPARIAGAASMRQAFELLRSYPTIGDFLAYQYVTDLNYSTLTSFSEMEFVVPGPGARDGVRKCFSDLGGLSEAEVIKLMADRQEMEFERLGLEFQSLWGRRLQLIDCQNLFCEVDKYARVKHPEITGLTGRTRIKQRYKPGKPSMSYWYPPKWGINDFIAKEATNVPELLWAER